MRTDSTCCLPQSSQECGSAADIEAFDRSSSGVICCRRSSSSFLCVMFRVNLAYPRNSPVGSLLLHAAARRD